MSLKKRARKSIALALVGVTVGVPTLNSVSAMEVSNKIKDISDITIVKQNTEVEECYNEEIMNNYGMEELERNQIEEKRHKFDSESPIEEVYSDKNIDLMKIEFQEKYGNKDVFKVSSEVIVDDVKYITEINGYTGDYRISVDNAVVYEFNYFEGLNIMNEKANYAGEDNISTYAPDTFSSYVTRGPDKLFMKVSKSGTKYTIQAKGAFSSSKTKTYTKTGGWYSGHSRGMYDNMEDAYYDWKAACDKMNSAAEGIVTGIIAGMIAAGSWNVTAGAIIGAITGIDGIKDLVGVANRGVQYIGNVGVSHVNYSNL
ncbi:MAG: hypothetical protein RR835_10535 [Peptostreptococcaceae bacterium]